MKLKRKDNKTIMIIFLLLVLVVGIGYAYLTSNLSITGAASVSSNTWDIHFANIQVTTGSVTATTPATIDSNDNTKVNYAMTLSKPGDFYEFTVDIVNAGTLPGKISLVTITGLDSTYEDIIEYSVNYINGNPVQVNDILNDGDTKTIKVRTYFKEDIANNELPENSFNLNLVLNITYIQSGEREVNAGNLLQDLAADNTCIYQYTGSVTDSVGITTPIATNVYYDRCVDKRNVIFDGFCWQIIRTTETGGMKIIYNGEPVDGKCESDRGDHKGIVQLSRNSRVLSSSYLYGSSFTYNTTTNEFTLVDTTLATWSNSTYQNLLSKFTCMSTSDTCTTLYEVNRYRSNTEAYVTGYTIDDTNYAQIGNSSFNSSGGSPAMVGYMFNKIYNYVGSTAPTNNSLTGNDVSYSNGTYTLLPADGESTLGTTKDNTHHYSCNNSSGTCSKVRFYYYNNYYIELAGAENIQAAISEMLYNNDVNKYNSSIKGIIDNWYAQNLSSKSNMLEDAVFCNDRNMANQSTNGWNKDGNLSTIVQFKNNTLNSNISCANETDQFAVSNNKAKLTYPVALATHSELYALTDNNSSAYYRDLTRTGVWWWDLSPISFNFSDPGVRIVIAEGKVSDSYNIFFAGGVRPVISLSSRTIISSGSGSETDPWIIE